MESSGGSKSGDGNSNDETNTSHERVGYEADDDQGNSSSSNSSSRLKQQQQQQQRANNLSSIGDAHDAVAVDSTPSSLNSTTIKTLKHHSRSHHHALSTPREMSVPEPRKPERECAVTATMNLTEETLEEQHHRRNFKRRRTFSKHRMASRAATTEANGESSLGVGNGGTVSSIAWTPEDDRSLSHNGASSSLAVVTADAPTPQDWNAVFKLHGNPHRQLLRNYTEAVEDDTCTSPTNKTSKDQQGDEREDGSGSGSSGRHGLSSEGFTSFFTTTESGGGSEEHPHHHHALHHRKHHRSGRHEDSSLEASSGSDGAPPSATVAAPGHSR
jgi:hypothetical protein